MSISFMVFHGDLLPAHLLELAGRLCLSGVMLTSGLGKLVDPQANRQAMADYGVPPRWVDLAAKVLPLAELVLSVAVLLDVSCKWAGAASTLLFLGFSLGIANLLRQERKPPCNCFGAMHSEPVSFATLLRAMLLAAVSAGCLALPSFALTPSPARTLLVLGGLAAGGGVVAKVARQRLALAREELVRLAVGQRLPAVKLSSGAWLNQVLPAGRKSLLLLTSEDCSVCEAFKTHWSLWASGIADQLALVELRFDQGGESEPSEVPVYSLGEADFGRFLSATPGGFLVDERGTILSPPVTGPEEIEALIRATLRG